MKSTVTKIGLIVAGVVFLMGLSYVLLNTGYFWQQLKFIYRSEPPKADQTTPAQNAKGEPNHLEITSLGISAPIVEAADNTEKGFQEALKTGVVHYPNTAKVGEVGNAYYFGHSSDFAFKGGSYKTVFALLPRIKDGAEIVMSNGSGDKFTYVVTEQKVVSSSDTSVLEQNTNGQKLLTLQTSYPVGTALKRYIVIAKLKE